ncbi:hypothetical protein EVG20_g9023 [Dentipellis fragilis]|uniref:DUF6535 domain-containing protein n=1 Tax=Dentipellis fragilis TaxID=205917 RepID=A0A4Y9Y5U6_9AGAM|nr:hypothetical protein EVG20_g9023 [Dentipellis fragilis]
MLFENCMLMQPRAANSYLIYRDLRTRDFVGTGWLDFALFTRGPLTPPAAKSGQRRSTRLVHQFSDSSETRSQAPLVFSSKLTLWYRVMLASASTGRSAGVPYYTSSDAYGVGISGSDIGTSNPATNSVIEPTSKTDSQCLRADHDEGHLLWRYSPTPPGCIAAPREATVPSNTDHRFHQSMPSEPSNAAFTSNGSSLADVAEYLSARSTPSSVRKRFQQSKIDLEPDCDDADESTHRHTDSQHSRCKNEGSGDGGEESGNEPYSGTRLAQNAYASDGKRKSRRTFGVQHNTQSTYYVNPDDYEKKYPSDEPFKCLEPNARVWKVYLDEAKMVDDDMVEAWRETIDILLVFAGLFSAVVTTFLVQSSQSLQPNYSQVSAMLLTELVGLQRAMASGISVSSVAMSAQNATSGFEATTSDQWVNRLWFISLTFSLATALMAVLVKQWLQYYVSPISGTGKEKAHIHHFRFTGLEKWHVAGIVGIK